jgi:hypothetical protein
LEVLQEERHGGLAHADDLLERLEYYHLRDGRILVVEYKGEDRWSNDDSKEKRALGELWAERSGGWCLFAMPKGKDWNAITARIGNQYQRPNHR